MFKGLSRDTLAERRSQEFLPKELKWILAGKVQVEQLCGAGSSLGCGKQDKYRSTSEPGVVKCPVSSLVVLTWERLKSESFPGADLWRRGRAAQLHQSRF